jgi:hypothetical protein
MKKMPVQSNNRFYSFSRRHFEFELRGVLIREQAGYLTDITNEWIQEGNATWERIYRISTQNKSCDIIVFSSVDMRTDSVRENGDDRVRLVMRWKTRNGYRFRRIARHNRLRTLFDNVKDSILVAKHHVFSLSELRDWVNNVEQAL